jgi:hypothetical protein
MTPEAIAARKAGMRLLGYGLAFLVAGMILLVTSNRETGGAVLNPHIAREGQGISFVAGLPATLGYVLCSLGVYRLATGRGPGHASKHPLAIAARALFGLAAAGVFFAGAYFIVMALRG